MHKKEREINKNKAGQACAVAKVARKDGMQEEDKKPSGQPKELG